MGIAITNNIFTNHVYI